MRNLRTFIESVTEFWLNHPTKTEKALNKLEKQAKQEGNYETLAPKIEQTRQEILAEKKASLTEDKKEVKLALEQEIVGRYYYMTGQVENRLARDIYIKEAIQLFKDKPRFEALLKP